MILCESVLNRVYNFARVCPSYKQGIACPKQGNKIEVVVLNRVCILGYLCPKQGQGFKPSAAHLYPNTFGFVTSPTLFSRLAKHVQHVEFSNVGCRSVEILDLLRLSLR